MKRFAAVFAAFTLGVLAEGASDVQDVLSRTVHLSGVAISSDGSRLAWVQGASGEPGRLYTESGEVHVEAAPRGEDTEPAFSPDGRHLAFFSTAGSESESQKQLFIDGSVRTKLDGFAMRPRWSHDGKRIAFLYIEGAGGGGPLMAAPAQTGVIDTAFHNQRIAVLDVSSGQVRQISPEALNIYDYDWSPDDKQFVVTAAPGPGDNNWWIAQIHLIDFETGQSRPIHKPKLQLAIPRFSPDGKSIAFIEGIMSDEGFHGGDLFTMTLAGGAKPVNRTANRKTSPSSFYWTAPDRITMMEWVSGGSAVSELLLKNGEVRTLWNAPNEGLHAFGNFPNVAMAANGKTMVAARSSFQTPPEIWTGAPGKLHQITKINASLKPAWGAGESIEWVNDGTRVQGWLVKPVNIQAGRKYPMIVVPHGGPSNMVAPQWSTFYAYEAVFSNAGYFVFQPNPRGSYGAGEKFTSANVKDFGHGDLRDVMTGIDAVIAKYPVDPNKLGITGWSYGGYMTMWTVTQTSRFKAAVAGAGIANWQSYYGQNLIDQWMIPFFGASVYDDPAIYRKSSPIEFIKQVKTPTLVIVGERDAECPAPQSYEFWHALRTLGVPTQLVVYKDEGHLLMNVKNRRDMQERMVAWFNQYFK